MNNVKRITKKPSTAARLRAKRVYTLEVALLSGPVTKGGTSAPI